MHEEEMKDRGAAPPPHSRTSTRVAHAARPACKCPAPSYGDGAGKENQSLSTGIVGPRSSHRLVGITLLLALVGALVFGAFNGPSLAVPSARADGTGALDWGVKQSFRTYIGGAIAHGQVTLSDGATQNADGTYNFPSAGSAVESGGTVTASYTGTVLFQGHKGVGVPADQYALELSITNIRITRTGDTGLLIADVVSRGLGDGELVSYPGVEFALLNYAGITPVEAGGLTTISAVPSALTEAGVPAFASFYTAGTALDPVTFAYALRAPAPAVTVTPATAADPDGQDLVVTGANFAPTGTGIYVVFGPDPALNPSTWFTDATLYQKALFLSAAALAPNGAFERTLEDVTAVYTDGHGTVVDCHVVSCGIVTMKAHGVPDRTQDTFTPVSFAWEPKIELSKSTDIDPAGEVITVTGSGFDPAANIGTRPPFGGQAAGVYVIFGKFAETWRPSEGAPSSARRVIDQKWAIPPAAWAAVGGTNPQYVPLNADGTFTAQLTIAPNETLAGNYAVVTYAGSGAVNASQELYAPISFIAPTAVGDIIPDPEALDPDVAPVSKVLTNHGTLVLGDNLVTATFDNGGAGSGNVLIAKYAEGAAPGGTAIGIGGVVYDVHFAPTASTSPNATLTVVFSGLAPDQALVAFDGESWAPIVSNDGTPAVTDATGNVTVVFGPNSTPTLVGLSGTPIGTLDEGEPLEVPAVTDHPEDVSITLPNAGAIQSVTFAAGATGNPAPTVQWQIDPLGSNFWMNLSGQTSPTLVIDAIADSDGSRYRAVFTNSEGTATTNPATLTVAVAPEAEATVAVTLDQSSVTAGGQVTGTVFVTTETAISGIDFAFSFDPAKLQVASITGINGWSTINCAPEGDPNQCLVQVDNTAGTVRAVFFRFGPGNGVSGENLGVATIVFNAIGATEGTNVDLTSALLSTADGASVAPVELLDSDDVAIEPAERVISGTVLLQGRTNHSGTTVLFGGYSAATSASGAFVLVVPDGTAGTLVAIHAGYLRAVGEATTVSGDLAAAEIMLRGGDATGDGEVNIFDLALIAGNYGQAGPWTLGNGSLEPAQAITPDINGVDGVNLFDLTIAAGNYGLATPSAWAFVP